jgi:DNA-binding beta-propeller fold protein YncE
MRAIHGIRTTALALLLIPAAALLSCHELTEYEGTMIDSVVFIRTSDLSVYGSIGGIEDGRVLYSVNNATLFVLSGEGMLYRLNPEEMAVDTVISVFSSTGSGIYDIVAPPPRSSLYLMGNGSQLVEVDVSTNTVADVFQVGPSPCCMAEGGGYVYVGDSQDDRLREVDPGNNSVRRWIQLPYEPLAVEVGNSDLYCLVTSREDGSNGLVRLMTPSMNHSYNPDLPGPGNDIQAVVDTSSYFTACPNWSQGYGWMVVSDSLGDPVESTYLEGHPFSLAATPDGHYLYVLHKLPGGTGLVTAIDVFFGGITGQVPIDGYPWDITVQGNGEFIVVLVGE